MAQRNSINDATQVSSWSTSAQPSQPLQPQCASSKPPFLAW